MSGDIFRGDIRRAEPAEAFEALKRLKDEGYNVLVDFTAVDFSACNSEASGGPPAARFEVVYRLMKLNAETGMDEGRVELRCAAAEGEAVPRSVASLWPIADWLEREVWDMFGIPFADRPDIKRLLLYEEFQGHPLRKDYPITKRQPLIGPASGEPVDSPTFNQIKPAIKYD
ncbi:MAG: hypothetical protein A3J74_03215 [Elusimicrobia bacterium RIFCSPHIGHO2_02_FULL_57_9]|nr:MAG: hypothetical protein A3J74_03215 [Elusimicrobia bacterium RIFCSPHIGHO2_02_FULL_57_9]